MMSLLEIGEDVFEMKHYEPGGQVCINEFIKI